MLTIVAGMPRSGSTWTYQVLSELLQRRYPEFTGLGFRLPPDPWTLPMEGRFIVKWHDACPIRYVMAPTDRVQIIYSYRDLRNVVYSYADKTLTTRGRVINYLPHLLQINAFWESTYRVVSMRYEDFWQDSRPWVVQLAAQVGEFSAAEIDEVNAKFSFKENQQRAAATALALSLRGMQLSNLSASISLEHGKLLHWNHIRKGTGNEWLTATEPELRRLSALLTPWLLWKGYEQHSDWVDRLLAAREQQGGCDGETQAEEKADGQPERGSADAHSGTGAGGQS